MKVVFGLYGKLPSAGDFIGRGFSPELRQALDQLLQSVIATALSEGANAFKLFEAAPSIVFNVRPGAFCQTGFIGGLIPSQDRVGRLFPFCLGFETDALMQRLPLSWPSQGLARFLCGLALSARNAGATADQVMAEFPGEARFDTLSAHSVPFASAADETVPQLTGEAKKLCFIGPEAAMTSADRALCSRLPWSAQVLGIVVDPLGGFERFFALNSLADPLPMAAILDGRWTHWGWVERTPLTGSVPDSRDIATVATDAGAPVGVTWTDVGDETLPLLPRIDKAVFAGNDHE